MSLYLGKSGPRPFLLPESVRLTNPSGRADSRLEVNAESKPLSAGAALCVWIALSALGWLGIWWLVELVF